MATVTFKIVPEGKSFEKEGEKSEWKPTYKEGQLIFVETEKKIYLDYGGSRTCYACGESGGIATGAMNYVGITITDPTDPLDPVLGTVKIGDEDYNPKLNDMAVYGTKEYIWRMGQIHDPEYPNDPTKMITVTKWFEIGDEEAPTWDE